MKRIILAAAVIISGCGDTTVTPVIQPTPITIQQRYTTASPTVINNTTNTNSGNTTTSSVTNTNSGNTTDNSISNVGNTPIQRP